jgi:cyanophycinase
MIHRRALLTIPIAMISSSSLFAQQRRIGRLVIIGGAEDKLRDRVILRRFVELCGGPAARIRVLCAASSEPQASWETYRAVFADLGVTDCAPIEIADRDAANSAAVTDRILEADGIFISGGDQRRLMNLIWESDAFRALHVAFHLRGCCVGGTSAGAAALSRHMLVQGEATRLPEKEAAELDIGLGFVAGAIIDQHFSERGRLGRLLSVMAQRPQMLGVGVDEDTALVIERGQSIEVIGKGAVTIVDGRAMHSNHDEIESRARLEMIGVRLHLLPAGHHYGTDARGRWSPKVPVALREAVDQLVTPGPIRG